MTSLARTLTKHALVIATFGCGVLASRPASADLTIVEGEDYSIVTNGRINAYLSWVFGENSPAGVGPGPQVSMNGNPVFDESPTPGEQPSTSTFRVRSGYASSILGLNIRKKISDDLKVMGRFALWTPIHDAGRTKNHESTPSMREHFLELEGSWGMVFGGRRMSLFSRGHVGINWVLIHDEGVGHPCNVEGNSQATCGFTGVGSMFPNRNAQIGYATPNMGGFQLSLALYDPTLMPVAGDPVTGPSPANYDRAPFPRFEAEANFDKELGPDMKLVAFVNTLYQGLAASDGDQTASVFGVGLGARFHVGPFGIGAGPWFGSGLGTATPFGEAVDATGELRSFWGLLAAANYRFNDTEFGVAYGTSRASRTDADEAVDLPLIESTQGIGVKVAQHVGPVQISVDYMNVQYKWHSDATDLSQGSNIVSAGLNFGW